MFDRRAALLTWGFAIAWAATAAAQFGEADTKGPKLGEEAVKKWRAGIEVRAVAGDCFRIVGTAPIPTDWPEQTVEVAEEDISPGVRVAYPEMEGMAKQMTVTIARLARGSEAKAVVTFEVRRRALLPPDNTDIYVLPDKKKLDVKTRMFLTPSPEIESNDPKIKAQARELIAGPEKAWAKVEAIYDWVRENVEYKDGAPLLGAISAFRTKKGDCEDMTSLFIALCRSADIPARTVWIPGHCYPEFYLLDDEGKGHWFPCQVAGSRAFGGMPDFSPILQKGDNFPNPANPRKRWHYLRETLTGASTGAQPQYRFVRELVAN